MPAEQLWSEGYKGDLNFEYDHSIYWPTLTKLCEEKRAAKKARWEAAGKKLGESEAYMLGEGPIAQTQAPSPQTPAESNHATVDKAPSQPPPPQMVMLSAEKNGIMSDDEDDDVFEDAAEGHHVSHTAVPIQRVSCG